MAQYSSLGFIATIYYVIRHLYLGFVLAVPARISEIVSEMEEDIEQPIYIVNRFMYSTYNDKYDLEVCCKDKCFCIDLGPENFAVAPALRAECLRYLDAERSQDISDDASEELLTNSEEFCH